MKRMLLSLTLLLTMVSMSFGQKKISEGTITYEVEWQLPAQMQAYAAMFPKEVQVYFKGDSASWKNENPMSTTTTITNAKAEFTRLLLDVPMMGKKFSVTFTPADVENMRDKMPEYVITPGTESKTLAGYKVLKHAMTEKRSNTSSEAWFTKDIEVPQNSFTQFFDTQYGFPVEFSSFTQGVGIKARVKEVKAGPVPADAFRAGPEYEVMTVEELMQIQGGGR
ncbi:MAG TPA: hypothetical protein VGD92_00700 [Sphingobacteriaceae bacterium]